MIDLKKYNQRMLAILGSLAALGILILILVGLFALISDMVRTRSYQSYDEGVVVDQNRVVDTANYTFRQEISILEPYQLDTTKPEFIVPIGQKDQTTKRYKVMSAGIGFNSKFSDDYYYSSFSGLYNNFVLIDYTRNIRIPIFESKVALTDWAYMKIDDKKLVLFKGTDEDSNKDGLLNNDDLQALFVFDVNTLKIKYFRFEDETVNEFKPLKNTSKIYVRTGRDIDGDKEFDYYNEPTDLYFYDAATGESETLVPEKVKQRIQDILGN